MKKIGEIITEDLFLNAFRICKNYCESDEIIFDVNFLLLKKHLIAQKEKNIREFYKKYIANDLVYSLPELFASDVVSVPKRLSGVREYRFFSAPSMTLYNSVGLLFVDCCSQFVEQLDFERKQVFSFYPTKFTLGTEGWQAKNDYRTEYKGFSEKLKEHLQPGDVVLKIDISGYFESISHSKLVALLRRFSPESILEKNNFCKESPAVLEFYLESLMERKQGIPQGRKNFVSDYFGYLYLLPFDIEIESLTTTPNLKRKCLIRYVDDIFLIFTPASNLTRRQIFKELLTIEQTLASWFYKNCDLSISPEKTRREIIQTSQLKDEFLRSSKKAVSSIGEIQEKTTKLKERTEIDKQFEEFVRVLAKFRIPENPNFEFDLMLEERESLKHVLAKPFQSFLFKKENAKRIQQLLSRIDFELTAEQINILIALFYLEQKSQKPFFPILKLFLQTQINLADKRHIHIVLACIAQNSGAPRLKVQMEKYMLALQKDDYGKYLLCFYDLGEQLTHDPIYKRICNEHAGEKLKNGVQLFHPLSDYDRLIEYIALQDPPQHTVIQPLKHYIYERRNERWDIAFNHFQNVFHELCKLRFGLADGATVKDVKKCLKEARIDDELLVLKFYDRRNFNAVSHPSQKGKPSVKVSREDLEVYEPSILRLITEHLLT